MKRGYRDPFNAKSTHAYYKRHKHAKPPEFYMSAYEKEEEKKNLKELDETLSQLQNELKNLEKEKESNVKEVKEDEKAFEITFEL